MISVEEIMPLLNYEIKCVCNMFVSVDVNDKNTVFKTY